MPRPKMTEEQKEEARLKREAKAESVRVAAEKVAQFESSVEMADVTGSAEEAHRRLLDAKREEDKRKRDAEPVTEFYKLVGSKLRKCVKNSRGTSSLYVCNVMSKDGASLLKSLKEKGADIRAGL